MLEDDSILKQFERIFNKGLDRIWHHHIYSKTVRPDNRIVFTANGSTNSSGNLILPIAEGQIPAGKTFYGYKFIQWADGYTPASPYVNSSTYGFISHGAQVSPTNMADYFPNVGGGASVQSFPLTSEYNSKTCLEFEGGGDIPYFILFSGPASTNIFVAFYGELVNSMAIALAKTTVDI